MQRSRGAAGGVSLVERVGNRERLRIHEDDGVDRRTALVEGVDAIEIRLRERATGECLCFEGGVDLGDGRFFKEKRPTSRLGGERRGGRRGEQQGGGNLGMSGHSPKVPVSLRGDRRPDS